MAASRTCRCEPVAVDGEASGRADPQDAGARRAGQGTVGLGAYRRGRRAQAPPVVVGRVQPAGRDGAKGPDGVTSPQRHPVCQGGSATIHEGGGHVGGCQGRARNHAAARAWRTGPPQGRTARIASSVGGATPPASAFRKCRGRGRLGRATGAAPHCHAVSRRCGSCGERPAPPPCGGNSRNRGPSACARSPREWRRRAARRRRDAPAWARADRPCPPARGT